MKFITQDVTFQAGRGGPMLKTEKIDLRRRNISPNAQIAVVMTGFKLNYIGGDHKIHRMCVSVDINEPGPPFGNELEVEVKIGLRDHSGYWDDRYSGQVSLGLIVLDEPEVGINRGTIRFPAKTGGYSTRSANVQVRNPGITQAAFLSGFDIFFDGDDHNINEILARVELGNFSIYTYQFSYVQGTLGLRDSSGNWDDPFRGNLSYTTLTYPHGVFASAHNRITVNDHDSHAIGRTRIPLNSKNISLDNIAIGLNEFGLRFTNGDHYLEAIKSKVTRQMQTDGPQVLVDVTHEGGLHDKNKYNDPFSSTAGFTLLAPAKR